MCRRIAPLRVTIVLPAFGIFLVFSNALAGQELAAPWAPTSEDSVAIDGVFGDIDSDAPGCAVGVVADRSLAFAKGYGLANLDYGRPITPSSNFYLGSVSKQFTAAAIAHAVREGHLLLDDPIQRWLPEIPEYERTTTVRHLIHHTSGLRDYLGLWSLSDRRLEDVHSDEETLELVARQKNANFPAGDEYLYSNTGYFLLSVLIERATDKSLRDYTHTHLLEPLGMKRSRFNDDRLEVMDGRVVGYDADEDEDDHRIAHPWNYGKVGAGGMYSNIEDLAAWDRNFYTEEVGGPGFTEQLLERGVLNDGSTIPYAFGLSHGEHRGLSTVSHGGSLAGFRSTLLRFTERETTVLVLCNFSSSNPGSRARAVADIVLADDLAPVVDVAADSDELEDATEVSLTPEQHDDTELLGDYYSEELEASYRILEDDGELTFEIPSGQRARLTPAGGDRFRARRLLIQVERGAAGIRGFTLDSGRVRGIRFERVPATREP